MIRNNVFNSWIKRPVSVLDFYVGGADHSTSTSSSALNPWFITGFIDGEGCFSITIFKSNTHKMGWQVKLEFKLNLHEKDKALLEQLQNYFSVGQIFKQGSEQIRFIVQSVKDLGAVINHFDQFPLLTKKFADYKLFKEAYNLIINQEHLTIDGLNKIIAIKASMNLGLSEEIKIAFPNIIPTVRPLVKNPEIRSPNWLAGFAAAEGCFYVKIQKSKTKLGEAVSLRFQLTQHSRDEELMRSLIDYLDCGKVYDNKEVFTYEVVKFSDIKEKILPFFKKSPIVGVKAIDLEDFCKVVELMQNKAHLTEAGLNEIRKIKAGMNRGRKVSS